jgi:hypothetical protein
MRLARRCYRDVIGVPDTPASIGQENGAAAFRDSRQSREGRELGHAETTCSARSGRRISRRVRRLSQQRQRDHLWPVLPAASSTAPDELPGRHLLAPLI